jgi:hypothetical protein
MNVTVTFCKEYIIQNCEYTEVCGKVKSSAFLSCYLLRLYWLMCLQWGWINYKSIYIYIYVCVYINTYFYINALNLLLQQTVTQTSEVRLPFRGQMHLVSCSCCVPVFIWSFDGFVGRRGKSSVLYLANSHRLFPPCWQNDSKNVIKF